MGPKISGYPVAFLVLNLLLAPLGALFARALALWHRGRRWSALLPCERALTLAVAAAWLVATTHALYPASLLRHVADAPPPRPAWELLTYALCALVAFLLFHASVAGMRGVVRDLGAPRLARLVPLAAVPIIALGVLLGVARVDSWDILTRPGRVADAVASLPLAGRGLADWGASTALALAGFAAIDLASTRQTGTARPGAPPRCRG